MWTCAFESEDGTRFFVVANTEDGLEKLLDTLGPEKPPRELYIEATGATLVMNRDSGIDLDGTFVRPLKETY